MIDMPERLLYIESIRVQQHYDTVWQPFIGVDLHYGISVSAFGKCNSQAIFYILPKMYYSKFSGIREIPNLKAFEKTLAIPDFESEMAYSYKLEIQLMLNGIIVIPTQKHIYAIHIQYWRKETI